MHHTLPLIVLALTATSVFPQAVLTSDEMAPPGTITRYKDINNLSVVDTNLQGANVTWNFSGITGPTDYSLIVTIREPGETPHGDQFPTANYAYQEAPGAAYRYFQLTPSLMQRVGSFSTNLNTYQDPQVEYVFPLQLGTTNLDTWDNTNSSSGGTYGLECIGTGTLILPTGTWPDALMVRVTLTEWSTFNVYFWYSSQDGSILLQYFAGDNFFFPLMGRYLGDYSTVAIEEAHELISDIRFANPVTDRFELLCVPRIGGQMAVDVMDPLGRIIHSEQVATAPGQTLSWGVDVSGLAAGLYQVRLHNDKAVATRILTFIKG